MDRPTRDPKRGRRELRARPPSSRHDLGALARCERGHPQTLDAFRAELHQGASVEDRDVTAASMSGWDERPWRYKRTPTPPPPSGPPPCKTPTRRNPMNETPAAEPA